MGTKRNYGINTDMFTNRDACHLAISEDDGRTWIGFRELFLDQRRNVGDYAMTGGIDRGMHQSQFVELGNNKMLLSFGQHWLHRSMAVFDLDWLYAKSRSCDFANGLDDWSVQTYYTHVLGHRALNRKEGATLVPHPSKRGRRVMKIARPSDPDVINQTQGATWNFPAGKAGSFTTRVMVNKGCQGFRIGLLDRWFPPTDITAHSCAMFSLAVGAGGKLGPHKRLMPGRWYALRFEWDAVASRRKHRCQVFVNGKPVKRLPLNRPSRDGISYVHFISTAKSQDTQGFFVESVKADVNA
jgi:hypothetical protein